MLQAILLQWKNQRNLESVNVLTVIVAAVAAAAVVPLVVTAINWIHRKWKHVSIIKFLYVL